MNETKTEELIATDITIPKKFQASSMDKLTFALRKFGDQQIHAVLDFNGHFDEQRIKKAVRLMLESEPVLGCRFIEHPKKPYWERMGNLDNQDYCTFVTENDFEKDIFNFITTPNDPREELGIKIRIFKRNNFDTLCVKTSHALIDGGGIQEYLVLLGKIYKELGENPNYKVIPNINGRRSVKQVLGKFNFFKKVFVFFKNMSSKPNWAFPWIGLKSEKPNYILQRFKNEKFRKIKEFGKKFDATINDMVLAAFYRAIFQIINPAPNKKLVTVVTVNLRAYLPNNKAESLCNLSSSSYPEINYIANETFADTLIRVRDEMKRRKKNAPGIGPALFIETVFKMNFSHVKKAIQKRFEKDLKRDATHPVFTNVGLVETNYFDFGDIKAVDGYLMTPIMNAPGFIFGLMTFNERMTMCMGYYEESYDKKVVERFFELIKEEFERIYSEK